MSDSTDEFIAHFGIKGMRWGVRRAEGANGRVTGSVPAKVTADKGEVTVQTGRRGRTRYTGGTGILPHPDAIKAKISKQKANASGVDALGNEELKGLIKRMNLEQDYARLNPRVKSRGEKFSAEAGKIAANTARGIVQQESNAAGKKAAAAAKIFAAAAAKEAFRQKRGPKDGGTYKIVRKAIGV